jgi:hypothetical protein
MDPNQPGPPIIASEPNPYAAPTASLAPAVTPEAPASPVKAARIAGALMLAAAPAALFSSGSGGAHGTTPYLAIIIDVVIGISLVRGNLKYRPWAVVRCILGGLIYGGMALAASQPAEAGFTVAYVGCLLLLLLGTPGKVRTIVGAVTTGLLTLLTYLGLLMGAGS